MVRRTKARKNEEFSDHYFKGRMLYAFITFPK